MQERAEDPAVKVKAAARAHEESGCYKPGFKYTGTQSDTDNADNP